MANTKQNYTSEHAAYLFVFLFMLAMYFGIDLFVTAGDAFLQSGEFAKLDDEYWAESNAAGKLAAEEAGKLAVERIRRHGYSK